MSGIHPISAVLLIGLAVVAVVAATAFGVWTLRQRRARRAREPEPDIVIDLTYMHESTRLSREASRRQLAEGRAARLDHSGERPRGSGER